MSTCISCQAMSHVYLCLMSCYVSCQPTSRVNLPYSSLAMSHVLICLFTWVYTHDSYRCIRYRQMCHINAYYTDIDAYYTDRCVIQMHTTQIDASYGCILYRQMCDIDAYTTDRHFPVYPVRDVSLYLTVSVYVWWVHACVRVRVCVI